MIYCLFKVVTITLRQMWPWIALLLISMALKIKAWDRMFTNVGSSRFLQFYCRQRPWLWVQVPGADKAHKGKYYKQSLSPAKPSKEPDNPLLYIEHILRSIWADRQGRHHHFIENLNVHFQFYHSILVVVIKRKFTSSRPSLFIAEHSRYLRAPISAESARPGGNITMTSSVFSLVKTNIK